METNGTGTRRSADVSHEPATRQGPGAPSPVGSRDRRPLSRRVGWGYATGDLGISIAYFALGFFFLYYLTDLVGSPPGRRRHRVPHREAVGRCQRPARRGARGPHPSRHGRKRATCCTARSPSAEFRHPLVDSVGGPTGRRTVLATVLLLIFATTYSSWVSPTRRWCPSSRRDYDERTRLRRLQGDPLRRGCDPRRWARAGRGLADRRGDRAAGDGGRPRDGHHRYSSRGGSLGESSDREPRPSHPDPAREVLPAVDRAQCRHPDGVQGPRRDRHREPHRSAAVLLGDRHRFGVDGNARAGRLHGRRRRRWCRSGDGSAAASTSVVSCWPRA